MALLHHLTYIACTATGAEILMMKRHRYYEARMFHCQVIAKMDPDNRLYALSNLAKVLTTERMLIECKLINLHRHGPTYQECIAENRALSLEVCQMKFK